MTKKPYPTPFETDADFEQKLDEHLSKQDQIPIDADKARKDYEDRRTFVIPEGFEAERDGDGRATGRVKPINPTPVARERKPRTHPAKRLARAEKIAKVLADVRGTVDTREHTGFSVNYYQLPISHPTTPGRKPYTVECNDVIEALGMSYAEGNVLKALWRRCAARQGQSKRGYNDGKYDAEKMVFFSQRVLDDEVTSKGKKE